MIRMFGRGCAAMALVALLVACGNDDEATGSDGTSTVPLVVSATSPGSPQSDASPLATGSPTTEPPSFASPDSAATPPDEVGEAKEYQQLTSWDATWESLSAMVLSPNGHLFVSDSLGMVLTIYDADGREVGEIPYESSVPPSVGLQNDLAIDPDGRLYLLEASAGARLLVYHPDGTLVAEWGGTFPSDPSAEDSIFDAQALAVAPDGHVFTAGGGHLKKFTNDGEFVAGWDRAGDALFPGDPHDMEIAGDRLYVAADSYQGDQSVILTYDFDGNLIGEPIVLSEPDRESRIYPHSLAVGPDGNLFVADPLAREIIVLSPTGEELNRWALEGEGEAPAYFLEVRVDDEGRVYVADDLTKRVVVFGTAIP